MTPGEDTRRWHRIDEVFAEALTLTATDRPRFLDEACGDDPDLRRDVEALLADAADAERLFPERRPEPVAGRVIDAFRLLEVIGRGGMGTVFLAERADGHFRQRVALKLLHGGFHDENAERRFRLERQILARLEHPNIARLLGGGLTPDGEPYFVMEHVAGLPITEYCDRHRLGIEQRLELFRTVCAAVQYAHRNLVVHRDLKPGNILVTGDGQVKLLDFGIARVLEPEAYDQAGTMTRTGARLMTPEYAAPEQVRGEAITTATDVYALGMLLFELLTGRRPYSLTGRRLQEVEQVVCDQMPPRPSTVVAGAGETLAARRGRSGERALSPEQLLRRLRGDLDNIVLLALRKEPDRRYRSVEQLSEDVRRHLKNLPVQARGDTLRYRAGKFARRHSVGLVATILVVLALSGGLVATVYQGRVANRERERAERINVFLQDMLSSADPVRDGRDVTVAEVLDRASREAEQTLAGRPEIEAGVRTTLGRTYQALGLYAEAEPHLRRALVLQRALHGERHADVAASMRSLAELLQARGDFAGADSLYRGTLALQRRLFGSVHAEVATTLDRLGQLRWDQGDYGASSGFYEQSLLLRRRLFGELHEDVAESINNLGLTRLQQGDYVAADSLARATLTLIRQLYPPDHVYVGVALLNAAKALEMRGSYEEAEALLEESLVMQRRRRGPEHPEVAVALDNLALVVSERGDDTRAEVLARQALDMRRRLLGDDHPDVGLSLQHVALVLARGGALAEAESLYRGSLVNRRRLGAHPDVALTLGQLAALLHRTGRHREADSLYREAIALHRQVRSDPHPITADQLAGWASLLADTGRLSEADTTFRAAVAGLRATVSAGNPLLSRALRQRGEFLVRQGRPAEAEPLLREAVEGYQAQHGPDHVRTLEARIWLGRCLTALAQYDEAEALLRESHQAARARQGAGGNTTQQAADALVDLYTRSNKPRQAAAYRELRER
jgi:eukaryotic-like serine/threonine-protein kinase